MKLKYFENKRKAMFVEDDTEPESMLNFPLLTLSAAVSIKQH